MLPHFSKAPVALLFAVPQHRPVHSITRFVLLCRIGSEIGSNPEKQRSISVNCIWP